VIAFLPTTGIENVAGKVVPSADAQSLIPVIKAKCKNRSPKLLPQPKQKFKESGEADVVPSPAIFAILMLCAYPYRGLSTSNERSAAIV